MALRLPSTDRYHVHPGEAWHVILAPHAADHRVYLARAGHQCHYGPGDPVPAPTVPPATLLAHWAEADPLAFAHVTDAEQLNLLMYISTADHHIYVTPRIAQRAVAPTYHSRRPS